MALVLSGDGAVGPLSATEVGYLDGVTSAVQTQINSKASNTDWTAYTPTWTNLTVGNGSLTARYTQVGKVVHLIIDFVLGSTSSVGTEPSFSLPVTATSVGYRASTTPIGILHMRDVGTQSYQGVVVWLTSGSALLQRTGVSGSNTIIASVTATTPWTWGSSDYLSLTATYEAA
jgi:hypothetical protein